MSPLSEQREPVFEMGECGVSTGTSMDVAHQLGRQLGCFVPGLQEVKPVE